MTKGFQKENKWRFKKGNIVGLETRFKKGKKNPSWKGGISFHSNVKKRVFKHYGGNSPKCANCGCSTFEVLAIDHIFNDGAKHRKELFGTSRGGGTGFYRWLIKNNFPEGYQVLCRNCNWLKYLKFKVL